MLIILSPAKTFRQVDDEAYRPIDELPFYPQTRQLVDTLAKYSLEELGTLLKVTGELLTINEDRYAQMFEEDWKGIEAGSYYYGEAFKGLDWVSLDSESRRFGQAHLRILSGLYGMLKPTQVIGAYRLEMMTKLETQDFSNLYGFWKDTLTERTIKELGEGEGEKILINLASNEYSKVLDLRKISKLYEVRTITFKQQTDSGYKAVSMYAKRARGEMARWILTHKIENSEALKAYNENGYRWCEELSGDKEWVFVKD